jgi:thiol-disulfide isomerase/thioredoxin/small nuclear ribonucleoprotein (snRNP)-like protein
MVARNDFPPVYVPIRWRASCLMFLVWLVAIATGPLSESNGQSWKVRLIDDSSITGKLVSSGFDDFVGIQSDEFKSAFDFDVRSILSLSRVVSKTDEVQQSHPAILQFELLDGSKLLGKLRSVDSQSIVIDSEILGSLHLDRKRVRAISTSYDFGELLYAGPSIADRWYSVKVDSAARVDASSLTSIARGATVATDLELPDQAHIVLELSWKDVPEFVIALGTRVANAKAKTEESKASVRLEVWNGKLIAVRETDATTDLAQLLDLNRQSINRIRVHVLLDQRKGKLIVMDEVGRRLCEIAVKATQPNVGTCFHVSNYGSPLSLDHLQVRKWSESLTKFVFEKDVLLLKDGREIIGNLVDWDSSSDEFVLSIPSGKQMKIKTSEASQMTLLPITDEQVQTSQETLVGAAQYVDVVLEDQSRIKVKFRASTTDRFKFEIAGLTGSFDVPVEKIASILGSNRSVDRTGLTGVMKLDTAELSGRLAIHGDENGSSVVVWHPTHSRNSSSLVEGANGSILYQKKASEIAQTKPLSTSGNVISNIRTNLQRKKEGESEACKLAFENGDIIEGKVLKIDEVGVKFESSQTSCQFATHDRIQSLIFSLNSSGDDLSADLLKRFTTIPRMQKDHAPTHLLISITGDHMRGKSLGLDDGQITMDVRNRTTKIPTSKISKIVWLHHLDWEEPQKTPLEVNRSGAVSDFSVHVMKKDDRGITFHPRSLVEGKLRGVSDLFGDCSVDLADTTRIFFGHDVSKQIMMYRQNRWTLSLARFPQAFLDEPNQDGPEQTAVAASKLIGEKAEEFTLKMVDGSEFQLKKHRGKIVVLDFWASWCGPCMQSMPKIDQLISNLESDKIVLATINVQESADTVRAALTRLGIRPTTLLDEQGRVAALYGAIAIPQTVIISPNGTIKDVIVGGSQEARDRIRASLLSELR